MHIHPTGCELKFRRKKKKTRSLSHVKSIRLQTEGFTSVLRRAPGIFLIERLTNFRFNPDLFLIREANDGAATLNSVVRER